MKSPIDFKCLDCIFFRHGKRRGDYNRKTGKRIELDANLCALYPPSAKDGRPTTDPSLVCIDFTDAEGNQPLQHLGCTTTAL